MQLQARDAPLPDDDWLANAFRYPVSTVLASSSAGAPDNPHWSSQSLAQQWQVVQSAANPKVADIGGAGLGPQDAIGVLITAGVLLGKRRLVALAQRRGTRVALVEHGLQFATVVTVDPPLEQMRGALGAAGQHTELAGTLKQQRLERRGTYKYTLVASSIWDML